jgi:putative heme transporter
VLTHPSVLRRGLRRLVLLARFVPGMCHTCSHAWTRRADQVSTRLSTRIGLLSPSTARWLGLVGLAAVPWLLDFASLAASALAVGSTVPWGALLVGFLLVQASVAAQILPGGAGLAETSLLGLLLASGVPAAPAAASVLIYRAITWLGVALLGWVLYAVSIHSAPLHLHRHAPELSPL